MVQVRCYMASRVEARQLFVFWRNELVFEVQQCTSMAWKDEEKVWWLPYEEPFMVNL